MNVSICLLITLVILLTISQRNHFRVLEGFTKNFFAYHENTYFMGISRSQMAHNQYTLIQTLIQLSPFRTETKLIVDNLDRYNQLNNNNIQLIMSHTNTIFGLLYQKSPVKTDNLRFVATLNDVPVNIITHYINIHDFGDLKKLPFKPRINVGAPHSSDYFSAIDILLKYGIDINNDIIITNYVGNEIYDHYGVDIDIIVHIANHPDHLISHLTNKKLSKFVNLNRLNNGNIYEISLEEQSFYANHNYYFKYGIQKNLLSKYYPHSVTYDLQYDEQSHSIIDSHLIESVNTISVKNNLISNSKVNPSYIEQFLYNIYLNLNQINSFPFIESKLSPTSQNDFLLPVPVHDGARNFYLRLGIYKHTDDRACALIDGRCSPEKLKTHHLTGTWESFRKNQSANARGNLSNLFLINSEYRNQFRPLFEND